MAEANEPPRPSHDAVEDRLLPVPGRVRPILWRATAPAGVLSQHLARRLLDDHTRRGNLVIDVDNDAGLAAAAAQAGRRYLALGGDTHLAALGDAAGSGDLVLLCWPRPQRANPRFLLVACRTLLRAGSGVLVVAITVPTEQRTPHLTALIGAAHAAGLRHVRHVVIADSNSADAAPRPANAAGATPPDMHSGAATAGGGGHTPAGGGRLTRTPTCWSSWPQWVPMTDHVLTADGVACGATQQAAPPACDARYAPGCLCAATNSLATSFVRTSDDPSGRPIALWPTVQHRDAAQRMPPVAGGLPVAHLASPEPRSSTCYVVTTVDGRGRLADRSPLRLLGWRPGLPFAVSVASAAVIIVPQRDGPHAITRQGHLRLPLSVRHACRLKPGDRVLLAASPDRDLLVAYTMSAVDAMVLAYHAALTAETVQ